MRIVLQKFFVVIRFDHERVHLAQTLDQHLRRVTEIGDKAEAARTGMKGKADWIDRVMRHGKSLNRDIADRKFRTGRERSASCDVDSNEPSQRIASAVSELQ